MEMYKELLEAMVEQLSKMIFDIDELIPNDQVQGDYKLQSQMCLSAARMDLREALDSMNWYIRKAP